MADLNKVLKGFQHCMMESDQDKPCTDCPYLSKPGCSTALNRDAVDLLKSQQAEIKEKDETIAELERCSVARMKEQQEEIERLKEMNRELVRLNGMDV